MFPLFRILFPILLTAFVWAGYSYLPDIRGIRTEKLALAILISDDADLNDPLLTAWQDAAAEEGLKLELLRASSFLRPFPFNSPSYAGLILPDSIHKVMSEALIDGVHDYVKSGGNLMLTFDAGALLLPKKTYARSKSKFSDLAGVDYILYGQLRDEAIVKSPVFGARQTFLDLHFPPGKFHAADSHGLFGAEMSLAGYQYDAVNYSHFQTSGNYAGQVLLTGENREIIAGVNHFGDGRVLFVNLPLGYLKNRTDGVLLHGFLRYFAQSMVRLPFLSSAPDGRGGLVMNLHIDSGANLPVLEELKKHTQLFDYGPYSIHITAGPDVNTPGDGLGFNVPGNKKAAGWLKFFQQRGYQIGSHGGWIHNYFGYLADDNNRAAMEPYLLKNKRALEDVTGLTLTEYSAPMGNHPLWVTHWLDEQKILGYYFTGDMGMGPTKPYRNEKKQIDKAWAFPVLNMGKYAAFEEMHAASVGESDVAAWLRDISAFTADDQVVRLMYFHPPGILYYPKAAKSWLQYTRGLQSEGRFSWYAMTDIAEFMNGREKTVWTCGKTAANRAELSAYNPQTLARQAWMLPKSAYGKPEIGEGSAEVEDAGNFWLVKLNSGNRLRMQAELLIGLDRND